MGIRTVGVLIGAAVERVFVVFLTAVVAYGEMK
jgi:hypothetical protein